MGVEADADRGRRSRRVVPSLLFAGALLTFPLPFLTLVSGCAYDERGATVSGLELATWRVDERSDPSLREPAFDFTTRSVGERLEARVSPAAAVAAGAAALGLVLALGGVRGTGACAAVGLAAAGWMAWNVAGALDDVRVGLWALLAVYGAAAAWSVGPRLRARRAPP